ncbi:Fic family protein [Allosaccharopolyspora coralli]|nr:Fic family protein [Allosaccharopolyspora coralli]
MTELFALPTLDAADHEVAEDVHRMRRELASALRAPQRWAGGLRRTMLARAIQGSNSIEGYVVSVDDAVAAVDEEEPLSAEERTWAEIVGYRQTLNYVLRMANDPHFHFDTSAIRSMHFMLLNHDLSKDPGQYRTRSIYVHDDKLGANVYEGPDAENVPELMSTFARSLDEQTACDPLTAAAMAHLNLVMIHPFRDGNGRMARALQTLVLARTSIVEPAFASIEEWLGHNTDDYYRILALTGAGHWNPHRDAHWWIKFNLRAHHMQAQTLRRRIRNAERIWLRLDDIVGKHALPERVTDVLYEAVLGYRVRRSGHLRRAELEGRTATRDFARMVQFNLLTAVGETRGRHYVAGPVLDELRAELRADRSMLDDPYPWMPAALRAPR